ncbi:hypothetical protein [uncultured Roseobacter sp.]|uniref:hypothetical protein n=1 Tax=uncultured Roseobacter sp. TaxID=114847 RepID=UPI00260641EB|nr:hypothetical protein [uncultured Roseobacter sp.]
MTDLRILAASFFISASSAAAECSIPHFQLPPSDPNTTTFELSLDYPAAGSELDSFSTETDFRSDWMGYLNEVLAYAFEGNLENDFVVQDNSIRSWFHTPWLHAGHSGREYVHGLTRERSSRPNELQNGVDAFFQNWGVGFYNEAAAGTLGAIWTDFCNPSVDALADVDFPEGSVSFKVLFTAASEAEIDALEGAPTWTAHIHTQGPPCRREDPCPREERTVTLLQIDVAIKDRRATDTGWVFGTFVYDKRLSHLAPWERLVPISIGWGNDPEVEPEEPLFENIINEDFDGVFFGWDARPHMGWNGRANGPVDNPISSCVSCHGTAQFPRSDTFANILPSRLTLTDSEIRRVYFQNIRGGSLFDPDVVPRPPFQSDLVVPVALDYSLQTQLGLEQLCFAWIDSRPPFDTVASKPAVCPSRQPEAESLAAFRTMGLTEAQMAPLERFLGDIRDEPVSKDNN